MSHDNVHTWCHADASFYDRGGTGVKYYEITDGDRPGSSLPEVHFCHEYKATGPPLSGMALLPPQCLDVGNVEVARVLRLTPTTVEPGGTRNVASVQGYCDTASTSKCVG